HLYSTYKSASGALLHELTHLMQPGGTCPDSFLSILYTFESRIPRTNTAISAVVIDQPAYDANGELEDPPSKSYGFSSCSNLPFVPNEGPSMALTNGKSPVSSLSLIWRGSK